MRRARNFLLAATVALSLSAGAGPGVAQESDGAPTILERARELHDSEGPAAALEFLAARDEAGELQPPAKALLGSLLLDAGRAEEAYRVLEPLSRLENAPAPLLHTTWRAASALGLAEERSDLLERAATLDPASPAGRQLGLLRGAQGRLREGFVALLPWIRRYPEDSEARLAAAHMAIELRRVPQAEELLAGLSQEIPHVRMLRARIQFLSDDPHGALATLVELGESGDLPPGLERDRRLTMAHAYMAIGEAGSAVAILDGRAAGDPVLALVLSEAQSQSGDVEAAVATIEPLARAVLDDPDRLEPSFAVGLLLQYGRQVIVTGAPAEAVEPLRLASELAPENEAVWQSLGQALALAGRREEATAALARFNELAERQGSRADLVATGESDLMDPTARELRRARELLTAGQPLEALAVVRTERLMAPRDPRGPLVASEVLIELERFEEALASAEDAIALGPDLPDGYRQRAAALVALGRSAEAEADLRRALEIAPERVDSLEDLARLLVAGRRTGEARDVLERLLALEPEHEAAAEMLSGLPD